MKNGAKPMETLKQKPKPPEPKVWTPADGPPPGFDKMNFAM